MCGKRVEVGAERGQLVLLDRVPGGPEPRVLPCPGEAVAERCHRLRRGGGLRPRAGQRLLARRHPVVEQDRVVHQEGRHAEPGGVADAEAPAQRGLDGRGPVAPAQVRQVLGQIEGEGAGQPDREHLGLEGAAQLGAVGDARPVGGAELARAVDRGGAHQIAGFAQHLRVGLLPLCQPLDDVIEEPHRAVGAAERQFLRADAPGLLQRHIGLQPVEVGGIGRAVEEREGRVPRGGNDPVGALIGGQVVGEGHEAQAAAVKAHPVDRAAHAVRVHLPDRAIEDPALGLDPAQQLAQE